MTTYDEAWVAREEARRAWMAENSLYRDDDEKSSCGVGLVVSVDGKKSRKVVEAGIDALKAIWHRGALDADGKTGCCSEAMRVGKGRRSSGGAVGSNCQTQRRARP